MPNPSATLDARNCPVTEIKNPPTASAAMIEQYFNTYDLSPDATPTSKTLAIIIGTDSSNIASISLHSGAEIVAGMRPFKNLASLNISVYYIVYVKHLSRF